MIKLKNVQGKSLNMGEGGCSAMLTKIEIIYLLYSSAKFKLKSLLTYFCPWSKIQKTNKNPTLETQSGFSFNPKEQGHTKH